MYTLGEAGQRIEDNALYNFYFSVSLNLLQNTKLFQSTYDVKISHLTSYVDLSLLTSKVYSVTIWTYKWKERH